MIIDRLFMTMAFLSILSIGLLKPIDEWNSKAGNILTAIFLGSSILFIIICFVKIWYDA
jgi:hypothetical protein